MKRHLARRFSRFARHCFLLGGWSVALFALAAGAVEPSLLLGAVFADNMVLERPPRPDERPFLWGWAAKGTAVSITLGGADRPRIKADPAQGEISDTNSLRSWAVTYGMIRRAGPLPEGPFNINIYARQGKLDVLACTLRNVVLGEIWLVVDPETGVKADLSATASSPVAGDVRLLDLATPNSAGSGRWQLLEDPATGLPDQFAVAAYWLQKMRSMRLPQPAGVLLVRESQLKYIRQNDFKKLPEALQKNPVYKLPFDAWTDAWERAGTEWRQKQEDFKTEMVLRKRRGEPMNSVPPRSGGLGLPSIDQDDIIYKSGISVIQQFHFQFCGVLH